MKFTASQTYLNYALGAAKEIRWRGYIRKIESLSDTIVGYTGWTEISSRILEIPSIKSQLEYELGQFTMDSIELTGLGIAWWDANVFNATASEYIELKIEAQLGLGGTYASDVAYMFLGFVDKESCVYNELTDSIDFSVWTAEDVGSRIAAENLNIQYINYDIDDDFTNRQGLILYRIKNAFVTDANISSYVLKTGVHKIIYNYDATPTRSLKLDDGEEVELTADNTEYTLVNLAGTEKVKVYVTQRATMPIISEYIDKVIVITEGDTLPKQFYRHLSGWNFLKKTFAKIGITDLQYNELEIDTHDSRSIVTNIDKPPDDETVVGMTQAIATDGTNLYIGVGNKVYKRTMATNTYTLLTTVTASHNVYKLIHNARNGHLWIIFSSDGDDFKIRRYKFSDDTTADLTCYAGSGYYSFALIDYNYTGTSYKYGIVYTTNTEGTGGSIRFVDGATLSESLIVTGETITSGYYFSKNLVFVGNNNTAFFQIYAPPSSLYLWAYNVDGSGNWASVGSLGTLDEPMNIGCFSQADYCVYYYSSDSKKVLQREIDVEGTNEILGSTYSVYKCNGFYYNAADEKVYLTGYQILPTRIYSFFAIYLGSASTLDTDVEMTPSTSSLTILSGIIYGVDVDGLLFQYGDSFKFYLDEADFEGKKITDVIYKTLIAFNLLATITATKKAFIYRRGNDSGTPQTTGNSLAISITNSSELSVDNDKYPSFALITLDNTITEMSYNGTTFGATILSDQRQLTINNFLIPSKTIPDLLYYAYQFFKTSRSIYKVMLGNVPLFQYEPFDAGQLSFTTTKIQSSASGVIYGIEYNQDGSMNVEVLI